MELAKIHVKLTRSKKEDISIRALDLAYKVKGHYAQQNGVAFNAPVQIVIKQIEPKETQAE